MSLGRSIELIQKHRAEEDLAVAAASILARHEFVTRLAALEKRVWNRASAGRLGGSGCGGKGVSCETRGGELPKVAKMHFRTALRAQGLPEPPRVPWERRQKGVTRQ